MASRIAVVAIVATLAAMLCCGAAAQTQWFNVNFDDYNLGDMNGQQSWSGSSSPVRIVQDFSRSGRCVEMDCLNFGGITGGVSRNVASGTGGTQYVEFRVATDTVLRSGQSYANLCYIQFFSTAGAELTRFYFRGNQFNLLLGPSDQHPILLNASDRQWHKIGLTFYLLTTKIDVKVDDVLVVQGGSLYSAGVDIGSIAISQWNQTSVYSKAECYVDDFTCSTVAQASVGKVALGPRFFPGWQVFNVCYPSVFFDGADSKYKMFYSGTGFGYTNDATWDQWTTGYVTSSDENKWLYPDNYEAVLFAHKFYEGDIVDAQAESAKFDSIFAYMPCVMKDGSTYKMWYTGWNGDTLQSSAHIANKVNFRIGYATSPDGKAWTKNPSNDSPAPVLNLAAYGSQDSKGVSHPSVLKKNGTYHMWYEGYDGTTWRIFHTTSSNGISWSTPQLVLSPGSTGANDDKNVRNPVVIDKSGTYEMWYQGESSASIKYHVLRATSSDGVTWAKASAEVTLHPTAPAGSTYNAYDPVAQVLPNTVIANGDGSYTVYYAKQLTETASSRVGSWKAKYFYIFREVVVL